MNSKDVLLRNLFSAVLALCTCLDARAEDDGNYLLQLQKSYQLFETYKDVGTVETRYFTNGELDFSDAKEFRTFFVRPDKFRFEWTNSNSLLAEKFNIIVRIGEDVVSFNHGQGYKEMSDLKSAVFENAGVSSGAVYFIPSLLMDEIPIQDLSRFENIELKPAEPAKGDEITILSLFYRSGTIEKIYVDAQKKQVLKLERTRKEGARTIEELITYKSITVDSAINDEEFGIKDLK